MIYLPKGIRNGDVVDPDATSKDYIEVNRVANQTSQYQFRVDEFQDNIDKFDDSICKVHYASKVCRLHVTRGNGPALPDTATTVPKVASPGTFTPTVDTDLFEVPVNKGMFDIPDTSVTWTSSFPELVHITFSFQYVRDDITNYAKDSSDTSAPGDAENNLTNKIRLQTAIDIDGTEITGSGPGGLMLEETHRGLGYASRSLITTVNVIQMLPAGVHTVKGVAGTLPISKFSYPSTGSGTFFPRFFGEDANIGLVAGFSGKSWYQNICIGTRNMIVTRYGRGIMMRT